MINTNQAQDVWKDAGKSVEFIILKLKRKDVLQEKENLIEFVDRYEAILRSQKIRNVDANIKASLGFSYKGWRYLFPDASVPKELEEYTDMSDNGYTMPKGIDGDLFLHIRADNEGIVYEIVSQLMVFLKDFTDVLDETKGFRYLEGRSIIGFIDGTENPTPEEAADYGLIGNEDREFINGSYAFAQKWKHNMDKWNSYTTEIQEKAIGRRKYSDLELDDQDKYKNAHNITSKAEINGEEQKIIRMNVPYSNPAYNIRGTYFIGYSRYWHVTKLMLENMLSKEDFLLSFSDILYSQLFFIPSKETLKRIIENEL